MSAAPPEMTPLFWNRVPSRDTAYNYIVQTQRGIIHTSVGLKVETSSAQLNFLGNTYNMYSDRVTL